MIINKEELYEKGWTERKPIFLIGALIAFVCGILIFPHLYMVGTEVGPDSLVFALIICIIACACFVTAYWVSVNRFKIIGKKYLQEDKHKKQPEPVNPYHWVEVKGEEQ